MESTKSVDDDRMRARNQRNRRGVSLLELVVAVGILAILAGLSLGNFGGAQKRAKARGTADVLAEEIRATRRRAMAKGYPVAMVFPTDGGTTPCTRSFYILEGREKGEFYRSRTLGHELADAFIFVGRYNGSEVTGDPPTGDVADTFDPVRWLPAGFTDNALIFTPTGRVRSNGLPVFHSSFHILTALGLNHSGTTATSATDPYTITVSPVGEVSVKTGAEGLSGAGPASLPAIASTVPGSAAGNSDPVISHLKLAPATNPEIYKSNTYGVSESFAQLYPERNNSDRMTDFAPISIQLSATDPDGDQLYCRFRSTPDEGDFSVVGDRNGWAPMTWDPSASEWRSYTSFLIPATAVSSEMWKIEVDITDGTSLVTGSDSFSPSLRKGLSKGKLAFATRLYNDASGDWTDAVYAMNLDGTSVNKVTDVIGVNENNPCWSPDGAYLTFSSTVNGNLDTADIYISTADGRYIYNLTDTPNVDEQFPVFSPDGNRIAFLRDGNRNGVYGLRFQSVRQGSTIQELAFGVTTKQYPASWDPTGDYLCYTLEETDGDSLVIQEAAPSSAKYRRINGQDPGGTGLLTDGNGLRWNIQEAQWCSSNIAGNGVILFRADNDGDGKCGLYLVAVNPLAPYDNSSSPNYLPDTDANPPIELLSEAEDVIALDFAPGGHKIAVACDPNSEGKYRVKILYLDNSSWPPTIDSLDSLSSGKHSFKPKFTSNSNVVIVQSAKDLDHPYKLYRIRVWDGATVDFQLLTHKSKDVISHSNTR